MSEERQLKGKMDGRLHGMDVFVALLTRTDLVRRIKTLQPPINHVFINNEDFDRYVDLLGVEDLVVVRDIPRGGGLDFKIELECVHPIPIIEFARQLSAGGVLVAFQNDDAARSPSVDYEVYKDGRQVFRARLQEQDSMGGNVVYRLDPLPSTPDPE